eukprot:2560530-Rhodomonas_salina.1
MASSSSIQSTNIIKPVESPASNSLGRPPVRASCARESMGCLVAGPSLLNTPLPSTAGSTSSMETPSTLQSNTPAT